LNSSAFFDDLYPPSAPLDGGVFFNQHSDRLVVTWNKLPHYSAGGSNTIQMILFADGRIQFGYRGVTAPGLALRSGATGYGTRVFYTIQGGYDTHFTQLDEHANLLSTLTGAVRAFLDDLQSAGLADRVAVLTFSEFGRRVAENDSLGTDHGTAAPVFLAGTKVKAGLVGTTPSLIDLQDGDLKMSIDFRRVYAMVLEQWLKLPSKVALGENFESLPLFNT